MSTVTATSFSRPMAARPVGHQRNIGKQFLLSVVTFGAYGLYWAYVSHEEIKQHGAEGVGGVAGMLLWLFAAPVTLVLLPVEIKRMYEQDQRSSPVGAGTAGWALLFGIPWFVKCQRALNGYWAAKGAPPAP